MTQSLEEFRKEFGYDDLSSSYPDKCASIGVKNMKAMNWCRANEMATLWSKGTMWGPRTQYPNPAQKHK
tara:strand:+ start:6238 stop:6444 length:207 start_codon:yes stop_codon:yes gene_type:complete